MIRYHYVEQFQPPAPFVIVGVRCPATGSRIAALPAQIDPAADRTVLPEGLVEKLGLVPDGRSFFLGFAGEVMELPLFLIELQVHDLTPMMVRGVLGAREPHILLGRDLLNAYRILLDGPRLFLEVESALPQ